MCLFISVFIGLVRRVCLWIPCHLLTVQLQYQNRTIITVMQTALHGRTFIAPPGVLMLSIALHTRVPMFMLT